MTGDGLYLEGQGSVQNGAYVTNFNLWIDEQTNSSYGLYEYGNAGLVNNGVYRKLLTSTSTFPAAASSTTMACSIFNPARLTSAQRPPSLRPTAALLMPPAARITAAV